VIAEEPRVDPKKVTDLATSLEAELGRLIVGQKELLRDTVIALIGGGHILLEGVPGLGKTMLVRSLGQALDLSFSRIQFTPDLMPADIVGTNIIREDSGRREFEYQPGPIFASLVLADEVNRATPKTQSALLEAMQERTVTVGNETRSLPVPFFVLATQNPIELEGTYPLPEAQLDRFLLQIDVDYPDRDAERRMLIATTGLAEQPPRRAMTADELLAAQRLVRRIPVGDSVVDAILSLVGSGRPDPDAQGPRRFVAWGPGPRASQALMLACRARALIDGRYAPSVEDVLALAPPVLRHRMAVSFAGRAEGVTVAQVIDQMAMPLR
jgi:MoxR-like ATPase